MCQTTLIYQGSPQGSPLYCRKVFILGLFPANMDTLVTACVCASVCVCMRTPKSLFIRESIASHSYVQGMQAGVLTQRCSLTTHSAARGTSPCLPNSLTPFPFSAVCLCECCAVSCLCFEGHVTSFKREKLKPWFTAFRSGLLTYF